MPKQIASMLFAALFVALAAVNSPGSQARAADDCVAAPNSQAPEGQHWYFRRDRVKYRKCWFLAPRSPAPTAKSAGHRPIAPTQAEIQKPLMKTPSMPPPSMPTRPAAVGETARSDLQGLGQTVAARSAPQDSFGQQQQLRSSEPINGIGTLVNSNTISIMAGNVDGTYLSIAYDMSAVLNDGDNLRILPVVGKGGGENMRDVRFLKGMDIGITQANLPSLFSRTSEIGPIDDKIAFIARLFNEEMHVVVRAKSGITSIKQLAGKKVNFSDTGSGTQLLTREIFERLAIETTEVNMGQNDAFEALGRGEIAATVLIDGKPSGSTLKLKASDGYRILPVPFSKPLQNDYLPTTLTHDDYPDLIAPGRSVDTIAIGAVLIAYNWPPGTDRYRRIAKFIDALFPRLAEFQKPPRHPKWREANLSATVPGWKRFPAAEEWLERYRDAKAQPATRQEFEQFLAREGEHVSATSDPERKQLFEEFLKWNRAQIIGTILPGARY
jgi:TRAP transporter TAXI family solute receptor